MLLLRPDHVHPSTVSYSYSQQETKRFPFSLNSVFSQAALAAGQCPDITVFAPDGGERGASRSGIPKGANGHGGSCAARRGHGRSVEISLDARDLYLGLVLKNEKS